MSIRIYTHNDCLDHRPGSGHPENPERLARILAQLNAVLPQPDIDLVDAPMGTQAQVLLAHTEDHWRHINSSVPASGETSLDADTHMSPGSLNAALRAVGAACQGVDDLLRDDVQTVFCATRPPGHHATPTHAMGFCLFNHVAIAALYSRQQYNLDRVAIVDFDVHHGNGTQDIMRGREGVFYISTHQSPLYPGTGYESDNVDFNILNVPLHGGTGHTTYLGAFQEYVLPALENYNPDLILVSAGFDAHKLDPLAGMALTDDTYQWLGATLKQSANTLCDGRLLSVLEGGYNLDVLGGSVLSYLHGIQHPA